jgi:integrase
MARERGLYRRKDSPYWWIDVVLPNVGRVCKSTRLTSEEDAKEYLVRLKAEAYGRKESALSADDRSWQESVVRYLSESRVSEKKTLPMDCLHLRQLDEFLSDKMLSDVNMDSLWPFIHARKGRDGVANATINRALEVVRHILNLAHHEWNWLARVPRIKLLNEPRRRVRFLTRDEADRLIAVLPDHLTSVVEFGLATGCRMGEILGLGWSRVDFERRVAWLDPGTTKSGHGRGVPLNNDAVLALRKVHGTHPMWCFTYQGKPMQEVGSAYERALQRAGIEDFRFHDLRHTWASWHVMSGTSLQELMELGGWKSYEMVLRYAHLGPEHLSGAAKRIERSWDIVENDSTVALR